MDGKLLCFMENHQLTLENKKIIVAVSGGPDSVALLHILNKWRKKQHFHLYAITIDHQLRDAAKKDVQYVEELCQKWNITLEKKRVDVRRYERDHKVSTQVAARVLRYKAFAHMMAEKSADYLALGHHGDDQVETIVMSMMRMTNLSGLQGIPFRRPFSSGEIIRPFLAVSKAEIEQYCAEHKLQYRIDSSNLDVSYTRNFIRKFVVPKLKEKNDSLHITVQQLAETLQEDERYLQNEAKVVFNNIVKRNDDERKVTIKVADLQSYPASLQRRIYRLTLDYLYEILPPQLSYSHEQIFLSLLKDEVENKVLHFPQQLIVEVVYDKIECYFKKPKETPFSVLVHQIPTTVPLPDGSLIEITYKSNIDQKTEWNEYVCSTTQINFPIQIRTRKQGDRMRYKGLNGSKKIKDIFIDEKVPRQKRDEIIVIADKHDEILWLVGIRKGILTKGQLHKGPYISFKYLKRQEGDIHA